VRTNVDGSVDINDYPAAQEQNMQVYPNPAVNEITLEFPEAMLLGYTIKIFTPGGQLIKTAQASQPQKAQVSITGLPRGMYMINVNTNNQNYNRIMIKK
jgi:hypothetical protein